MIKKRTKIEILYDILLSIRNKNNQIKISHLLQKANLSHPNLKKYLLELKNKNLVSEKNIKSQKYIILTEKGSKYLDKLKQMKKFIEYFDI